MFYDLPLFGVNVKIWKYLGFIAFGSYYRTIPIFFIVVLTLIGQIHFIFVCLELRDQVMSLFMTAIILNSTIRISSVMKNQQKFLTFMQDIERWYREIELNNDVVAWSILKKLPTRTGTVTKCSFFFGSLGAIMNCSLPFVLQKRTHVFDVHFPGFDVMKSPIYEIVLAIQITVVVPFIIFTYIPFTNLFIAWLLFGINILKVLRKKIGGLPSGNDKEQLKSLKILIRYHKRIIRFGKTLEDLVSLVCLAELLLLTMMLSVLLVCMLLVEDIMFQIATVVYIICIFYAIFISYWHANEFSSESVKIADAVYNIDWTNSSMEVRRCVLVLLVRCQTSLKVSAGGMYPMTLESFQELLNATYTYFNMARGFMGK